MKLIDMLVEDGLNGWQWPDGVEAITQDSNKSINKYKTAKGLEINEHGTWRCSSSWQGYLLRSCDMSSLADDCTTAIITREQYEAALAAKNDGWIEWGGGECPVSDNTMVDVRYRNGEVDAAAQADFYEWGHGRPNFVTTGCDIIAYRLHQQQEVEQAEADDETDLNECIGQGVAPVWNGEGLPPVGCECEYQYKVHGSEWCSFECVAIDGNAAFGWSNNTPIALRLNTHNFRPIRSDADRKRDESLRAIYEILDTGISTKQDAADIYDAIAAGKIPGVKLEV